MKMTHVSRIATTLALAVLALTQSVVPGIAQDASQTSASPSGERTMQGAPAKASHDYRPDIVIAVKAAAAKDCGCTECAAKGCEPCHGKNCYFCAAKSLVAMECGCGMCDAKGCDICGPGCDVC